MEAITSFSLTANDIENLVDELSPLGVMTLCPVVSSTGLTEDEVVRAKELTDRSSTNSIHGAWLQIDEDGARDILVVGGLVEVHVHALELKVRSAMVHPRIVKTVFTRDVLPEGGTDLITALADLEMNLSKVKDTVSFVVLPHGNSGVRTR